MDTINIDISLKTHDIRPTKARRSVLDVFYRRNFAMSQAEIQKELTGVYDRATIYRTLNKFISKGIIHKVVDESNITRYALCNDNQCDIEIHRDEHVHFRCKICDHVYCLNSVEVRLPALPPGYQTNLFMITAEGICKDCASTEQP